MAARPVLGHRRRVKPSFASTPSPSWIALALCLAGCGSARTVAATRTATPPASQPSLLAPQHAATYRRFAVATDHPAASSA